ncbi:beta-glucosidase [Blastomyces silverae]|uniref:Beta-glucosidase n=1 Tax=Blastomyces silverae TaxID=2060906 RepID=A0A0H1BH29_9EURO|nr:beta-glucosidase [Blastomyces silverae]
MASYRERIVPLIHGWIQMNPGLKLMQDGAPGHAAAETSQECGITSIDWPPYSPDLNPMKTVWNLMKQWIQENHGDEKNLSYDGCTSRSG